jgi:hypothetical protein
MPNTSDLLSKVQQANLYFANLMDRYVDSFVYSMERDECINAKVNDLYELLEAMDFQLAKGLYYDNENTKLIYQKIDCVTPIYNTYITIDTSLIKPFISNTIQSQAAWGGITGDINNQQDLIGLLSLKQNNITLTTTGSSGAATLIGATLNIPNYAPDLTGYVTLGTTQTITGAKTFSLDSSFNGVDIGRGGGNIVGNTRVGSGALTYNTTGSLNTAIGVNALGVNTIGSYNTALGGGAGFYVVNGFISTLNTNSNNSVYLGNQTRALNDNETNQIVIGYQTDGNGSNTVTIGNSSITDNYFKGNVRGGAFIKTGGLSSQFLKADGSVDSVAYGTGSVTSVAALTLGTTGTDLSSTVANSTTTPVITLNVPTASATNRGALSSTDWSMFNAKQPAGNYITSLTGEATASGPGAASVTLDNTAVIGKVLTGLNVTGGTVVSTDSILTALGKVQNQINGLIGGSIFQGVWDANTNTPALASSVGTNGYYYIVSVAGSTNLNGITDWKIGDWAIFAGTTWQKVDNTDAVASVNGYTGTVSLVTGDVLEGAGSLPSRPSQLYFTNARARAAISLTTSGSSGASTYDSGTGVLNIPTYTDAFVGTVTSVGLTMPVAFAVANSPITSSGTLEVTAIGSASQYIRGDGTLATIPSTSSGGANVNYYLNGSVAASVATYKQMDNSAIIGAGTDFNLTGNGLIAQFLTDAGNPNRLLIPGGAWNFEMYFNISSSGGNSKFYVELLKYDGTTFTSIASSVAVPEEITGGTTTDLYITSLAVPETALLITDRLALRVYIVDNSGGRTVTLHTEDNTLCLVTTTFAGGIAALNGLTANTQYFATGTTGTDFNISSVLDTHTFNIPSASATARGLITTGSQTIAGTKTFSNNLIVNSQVAINDLLSILWPGGGGIQIDPSSTEIKISTASGNNGYVNFTRSSGTGNNRWFTGFFGSTNADDYKIYNYGISSLALSIGISNNIVTIPNQLKLGSTITNGTYTYTLPSATGTLALTSALASYVPYTGATGAVNLGAYDLTVNGVNIGQGGGGGAFAYNTAIGQSALASNTTGIFNTAIGFSALSNHTTGNSQTALGLNAGRSINSGANNVTSNSSIYIGVDTRASADGNTNEIVIGHNTLGGGSNSVTLGNTGITNTYLRGAVTLTGALNGTSATFSSSVNIGGTSTYTSSKLIVTGNSANGGIVSEDISSTGSFVRILADASSGNLINYKTGTSLRFATSDSSFSSFVQRAVLNSDGNLGLGVTPSAWSVGKAIEIGNIGNGLWNASAADTRLMTNAYYDGAFKYGGTGAATMMETGSGFIWRTAPNNTGGAGAAITFTQAMALDANGRLLINRTNDGAAILRIQNTDNNGFDFLRSNTTGALSIQGNQTGANNIVLAPTSGNVGIGTTSPDTRLQVYQGFSIRTDTTGDAFMRLYRDAVPYGHFYMDRTNSKVTIGSIESVPFTFDTNGTERMRIWNTSGNVHIGTTPTSDAGYKLDVNGTGRFSGQLMINQAVNNNYIAFNHPGTQTWYARISTDNTSSFVIRNDYAGGTNVLTLAETGAATFSSSVTSKGLVLTGVSGGYTTGDNTYINFGADASPDTFGAINVPFGEKMKFNSYHGYEFKTSNNGSSLVTMFTIGITGAVTLSNLAGTGSRAVLADANGLLSAPVSDISVKENIQSIGYGLNEIVKMNPVWFDFVDDYKNFGEGRQNGNIAQEMQKIIPEAVFTTPSTGKMGINYDQLHAVYIKAIQELLEKITQLENK